MKTLPLFLFLVPLGYLALGFASAQTADQYAYTKPDSAKAYWTLRAAATDQTPTVQFYNAHHQLLYQETLPISAQRVNRQTRRALDKMLTNLVNNQVLSMTYLNQKPGESAGYPLVDQSASEQVLGHVIFRKGIAVFSVEPSLSSSGKLRVNCAQFSNRWRMVSLEDVDHHELFAQRFKTPQYRCNLTLTELPSGVYYLKVGQLYSAIVYELHVDQSTHQYKLRNQES